MLKKYSKNTKSNSHSRQSFASLFLWRNNKKSYKNNPNKRRNKLVDLLLLKLLPILTISLFTLLYITAQFSSQKQINNNLKIKKNLVGVWAYSAQIDGQMQASFDKSNQEAQVKIQRDKSSIEFSLPLEESSIETEQNQITYTNKSLDQKIQYQVIPNGIKEEIILYKRPASNVITTQLDLTNLTQTEINGLLVFFDQNQDYQFHFEKPFVQDSQGNRTYSVQYKIVEDQNSYHPTDQFEKFSKELLKPQIPKFQQNQQYNLEIIIDQSWLDRSDIAYPITIDPTVIHDESSEFNGYLDRLTDTGSGSSPSIESYYQVLPADSRTVAVWHFDETADNSCTGGEDVCDSSGNALDGTATGTTIIDGKIGKARSFNGSTDLVSLGNPTALQMTGSQTIEMWLYPTSFSVRQNPFNKAYGGEGTITQETNGTLNYYYGTGGGNTTPYSAFNTGSSLQLNTWNHVAIVRDLENMTMTWYINGQVTNTGTAPYSYAVASSLTAYIGDGYTNNYSGYIDEFRISNTARSAEEIKTDITRRPDGIYTSPVIDLTQASSLDGLYWQANGIGTGDGETATSSATSALVGQWNFNETSGTTADNAQGNSALDGTLTNYAFGAYTSQDGAIGTGWTAIHSRWGGGALKFDGINDSVDLGNNASLQITGSITISAWIKADSGATSRAIYSKWDDAYVNERAILFGIHSDGTARLTLDSTGAYTTYGTAYSSKVINDEKWHYVVGVYDGSTIKIYVDGQQDGVASYSSGIYNTPTNAEIGSMSDQTDWFFDGTIDAVQLYSRALTASEVLSNYNSSRIQLQTRTSADNSTWGAWSPTTGETQIEDFDDQYLYPTSETGLVSYWPMDETADNSCTGGEDVCDITASNDGTDSGGSTIVNGLFGKARDFDGSNDYLSLSDNASLDLGTSDFTISAWVKLNTTTNDYYMIYDKGVGQTTNEGRYSFLINNTDNLRLHIYGQSSGLVGSYTTSTLKIDDTQWHYIAVSADRNGNATFILDSATETVDISGSSAYNVSSTDTGSIGIRQDHADHMFNGLIDELSIYNTALSSSTLHNKYLAGSNIYQNNDDTFKIQGSRSLFLDTNSQVDGDTVLYYSFDDTNGDLAGSDVFDYSGNGNDGEINGTGLATSVVEGISGKARKFNGSDDYIDATISNFTTGSAISYEAWFKPSSVDATQNIILDKNYSIRLEISTSSLVNVNLGNGSSWCTTNLNGGPTIQPNNWYHALVTYDNTTLRLYVNGELANSTNTSCSVALSSIRIGEYINGSNYYFPGTIDELKIHSRNLTAQDAYESYLLGADHYLNKSISSTDLSTKDNLPFYIAADEPGTYLQSTIGESAYVNYQPDTNTVGLWHLDEVVEDSCSYGQEAPDACDSSGYSFDGTEVGTTSPGTVGVIGKGRYFAGDTDYLSAGNHSQHQLTTYTIDGWFKANSDVTTYRTITGKQNSSTDRNWWIALWTSTGVLNWRTSSSGALDVDLSSSQAVNDDEWHHFAAVLDGASSAKLYLDGTLVAQDTSISTVDTQSSNLVIGTQSDSTTRNFLGYLDEIRVSNIARSASDIRQAYEVGRRSHPITIDFGASLDSGNLISSSADTSFTIDATSKGASNMGDNLYYGDKVIVKENYGGTEYIAQGDVTSVNPSTGAVTIDGWDTGSTFPASGYTTQATVFKWQEIFWDLAEINTIDRNAITNFTFRITDGNMGRNIWFDDLRSNSGYLTNPFGSTITSTAQRYFQYRAIFSSSDSNVSSQLTSVTLEYSYNNPPTAPTSLQAEATTNPTNITDATPEFSAIYNDPDSGDTAGYYQLQVNTSADFTGTTMWDSTKTAISSVTEGTRSSLITYAGTTLEEGITYYWRIKFWDAIDTEGAWSTESAYFSTIDLVTPAYCTIDELSDDSQLTIQWTDSNSTEDNYILEKNTNGGGYTSFQTLAANTTSYADSAVSQSNTYVYRVKAVDGDFSSPWCSTDQLSLQSGNFNFEGLNMEGLDIN